MAARLSSGCATVRQRANRSTTLANRGGGHSRRPGKRPRLSRHWPRMNQRPSKPKAATKDLGALAFEALPDVALLIDPASLRIIDVNRADSALGYPRDELLALDLP